MKNYLTIDVEEYFQVSAFEDCIDKDSWPDYDSRVTRNTQLLLDILSEKKIHATFFVVGWIAERHPELVLRIQAEGHEIGCHSYWHRKIYDLSPEEFREDTLRAKEVIENITGVQVIGYRAPSYSITRKSLWALDILKELGFEYDSSIFPIVHDNYGIPDAPRFQYLIQGKGLMEYPISTSKVLWANIPISGGGYFRLFPYWFTRTLLRRINSQDQKPFLFYLHPWEIDPDQPRMNNARFLSKFRHYNNLEKTALRLKKLIADFQFGPIT